MRYIFIFNGRPDKAFAIEEVNKQLKEIKLEAEQYVTTAIGDATRYVNIFCDLNPKEEVCFVACGGAGLTLEVVSALVGRENKYFSILSYGGTNDFIKIFPGHKFQSLEALLNGQLLETDIIRINDNYALNCVSIGMDALACALAQMHSMHGESDPYNKGIRSAFLFHRHHRLKIKVDGKPIPFRYIQNGQLSNGRYTGGEFHCAPNARIDDGLIDVCIFRIMPALAFIRILKYFRKGEHLTNRFCRKFIYSAKARHIEIRSKDLIYIGNDGEYFAASAIDVDILDKAVKFILPGK